MTSSTAGQPVVQSLRRPRGSWYYWITILSAGLLAWAPFAHAGQRLGWSPRLAVRAGVFGAIAAAAGVVVSAQPTDADGQVIGPHAALITGAIGMVLIAVVVIACLMLVPVRAQVYGGAPVAGALDPAVAAVLAARGRRDSARELVVRDPLMARELGIGRPDLGRGFDDGGLVDLATAPAEVIAAVCGLDLPVAQSIVAARGDGTGLITVGDALLVDGVPTTAWDVLNDRGIVLGR